MFCLDPCGVLAYNWNIILSECHLVYIWDAFNRCSLNVDFTVSKLEWSEGGGGGEG